MPKGYNNVRPKAARMEQSVGAQLGLAPCPDSQLWASVCCETVEGREEERFFCMLVHSALLPWPKADGGSHALVTTTWSKTWG